MLPLFAWLSVGSWLFFTELCVFPSFTIILLGKRELVSFFLLCSDCHVAVFAYGAVGWSVVCECGISWSYSLTFCESACYSFRSSVSYWHVVCLIRCFQVSQFILSPGQLDPILPLYLVIFTPCGKLFRLINLVPFLAPS